MYSKGDKRLQVVVGAQFGSEAKGHVVQRLVEREHREGRFVHTVRVAGPNAGHTGYDQKGKAWALRQVPVAAVVPGTAVLGIAAGSEIDLPVLLDEINRLQEDGLLINKTLWISGEATLIDDHHKQAETDTSLVKRIGSTGKGIGAARSARIMRDAKRLSDDEDAMSVLNGLAGVIVARTGQSHPRIGMGETLVIEGTQGYGLGLHAGFYPQCTSSDCRAVDFMAMAGVHPWEFDDVQVWAVARMFPIRVAGNSGPLMGETTWEDLGLPKERTTVTKKVRRVGQPDWSLVRRAVQANGGAPTVRIALTMVDQMFKSTANQPALEWDGEDWRTVRAYVANIESITQAEVQMVTTGPNMASFL